MSTTATVTINLEINLDDSWGDDCTISQIKNQAISSAKNKLMKVFANVPNVKVKGDTAFVNINVVTGK